MHGLSLPFMEKIASQEALCSTGLVITSIQLYSIYTTKQM
jgi:hypothetical protein